MDLILLHAPSVFDFRRERIFYGPISDVVPSTPIFEMYPVGMASIASWLERHGLKARIVNLAYRMLQDPSFDPAAMIGRLKAPLFGVDLHWLPHAHGSLEVARLVKEKHPGSKLVMGGLSSTYFQRELMNYPHVDFVMRGDSTEEPMRLLVEAVRAGGGYESVPNLTWRAPDGSIRENPLSNVPANLDQTDFSYRSVLRQVFRHGDLRSVIPFQGWLRYPITMPLMCRGCVENCVICGGSRYAFRKFFGRDAVAFRSPKDYVADIVAQGRMTRTPVFLVGDLRQAGMDYALEVFDRIRRAKLHNEIILEFFRGVDENFFRHVARSVRSFSMEMSPETHDETARLAAGKIYTNAEFEDTVRFAIKHGARRVDVFYMTGIVRQDYNSVMNTVEYSRHLMRDLGAGRKITAFISPLAPFLDPGSIAFEEPEKVGYTVRFRTLEEHRKALLAPSWKYTLNYHTDWMSRDEIVDATYEAALRLNDVRRDAGMIEAAQASEQRRKIEESRRIMAEIDQLTAGGTDATADLSAIYGAGMEKSRASTLNDHREILWSINSRGIRLRSMARESMRWLLRR